jgi:hypothetical protein
MRRVLMVAVLAFVAAGCGERRATYDRDEVVDAFKRHGYTLGSGYTFGPPRGSAAAHDGDLLAPRGGAEFIVLVISDAAADDAWHVYESQPTFHSFDARRANVVVISDSGLRLIQRRRVLDALSSLPARGAAVMIAGRK